MKVEMMMVSSSVVLIDVASEVWVLQPADLHAASQLIY